MNYGNIMRGVSDGLERRAALLEFFSKHEGCLLQIFGTKTGGKDFPVPQLCEYRAVPEPAWAERLVDDLTEHSTFKGALRLEFTDQSQGGKEYRLTFRNGRVSGMNRNAFECTPGLDDGY